jgi:predicted negative regulator of RcsB-dependent stress response
VNAIGLLCIVIVAFAVYFSFQIWTECKREKQLDKKNKDVQ